MSLAHRTASPPYGFGFALDPIAVTYPSSIVSERPRSTSTIPPRSATSALWWRLANRAPAWRPYDKPYYTPRESFCPMSVAYLQRMPPLSRRPATNSRLHAPICFGHRQAKRGARAARKPRCTPRSGSLGWAGRALLGLLLRLELHLVQGAIQPPLGQELVMRAHLGHLALIHHIDALRPPHRRKPMRDDDAGALSKQLL